MNNEKKEKIYFLLDDAREELAKRWQNEELKKAIEEELGENFWPEFKNEPRGVLGRQLASPDNGLTFFFQLSKYINVLPLALEYLGDKFLSLNEEKKALGRLSICNENNSRYRVDLVDFELNEGKKIKEVTMKTGENLVDFHHNLLKIAKFKLDVVDSTEWIRKMGEKYYYAYLLHFIAHGVLFEFFLDEDEMENGFTNKIVMPSIKKIEEKFGFKPIIVRLYPKNQNDEEDFYWFSYPSFVNRYIIKYAEEHDIPLKEIK